MGWFSNKEDRKCPPPISELSMDDLKREINQRRQETCEHVFNIKIETMGTSEKWQYVVARCKLCEAHENVSQFYEYKLEKIKGD